MKLITYLKYLKQKLDAKKHKTTLRSLHISRDFKYGNYCLFGKECYIDRNVIMGNYNYFNANQVPVLIESNTVIGSFCSIAPGVFIGLGNHDVHSVSTHPIMFNPYYSELLNVEFKGTRNSLIDSDVTTIIGNDVWVGAKAMINRGVNIGDGAVIAGGAIVTKDVQPYSIVGGVPAKVIGYRFDTNTIRELTNNTRYCLWNWDELFLKQHLNELNNIDTYLKCISKFKAIQEGKD